MARALPTALFLSAVPWMVAPAWAAEPRSSSPRAEAALTPSDPAWKDLVGKNLEKIEVVFDDPRWTVPVSVRGVQVGQLFTPEVARRALDELGATGRFGDLWAEAAPLGAGVILRLHVVARRIISAIRVRGVEADLDALVRAAGLRVGSEIVATDLSSVKTRMKSELSRRGFPDAKVQLESLDSDDPLAVVLIVDVVAGLPAVITERRFAAWPDPGQPGLITLLDRYAITPGERADLDAIEDADLDLSNQLRAHGYYDARVEHALRPGPRGLVLEVRVYAGSRFVLRFEGNRRFDATQLEDALELEESSTRTPAALTEKIQEFYAARGLLDASVVPILRGKSGDPARELLIRIDEGEPVRVVAREYPCLSGGRDAAEVKSEIDSFLSELPGGTLVDPVDPGTVDELYGPHRGAGTRPRPFLLNPWSVYAAETYEQSLEHLQDLFRSEGYLSARVGPAVALRATCDPRLPPGTCKPLGAWPPSAYQCRYDGVGLPADDPPPDAVGSCVRDGMRGVRCSPQVTLRIPIRLGPRSFIEAIELEGNQALSTAGLLEATELSVGSPVSQVELERARRRLLDTYAEEAFAFAEVEPKLELSPDHRRARVRFSISERKRVRVSRIVIRGARITNESLIRSRVALTVGGPYRRSLIRKTEERLGTLGVFASASVGLEDPYVPASQKVVVVSLQERKPQYLDVRPGFGTGEGFRISFEYGHRNLMGEAIQLTLRSQLGFLPLPLIFEDDVRHKYADLKYAERLERRNTVILGFPEVGLGPLFRFVLEGIDVRDNARDFGLTKNAGIGTLSFLPSRRVALQVGASLERNNAKIFGEEQKGALNDYILANPSRRNAFRVPEGPTFVIAERVGATWDRRDDPLDATSGTFVSAGVEYVTARPLGAPSAGSSTSASVFDAADSNFLRYTNRLAGYVRLSRRGLALAMSFRWGLNQQLTHDSRTYPDRLFFLGGIDSLRGFLQDSVVPEDIAEQLLDPGSDLDIRQIVIRGGDIFVNPRAELRIPLNDTVQAGFFVDSGNLWTDPSVIDVFRLRYATGTGLRVGTPIGPLVFDYGFNVDRVLDALDDSRPRQRYWESLGAFHFSIGLF